jgi:HEAT repeat protein
MNSPEKSLDDSYSEVLAMEASKDVKGLIEIIKNSQKKLVIRKAVWALGRIKSPEAVEPLMELVLKNPLSSVRSAAIMALSETGSDKPTQLLLHILLSSKDPSISVEAARALGKIRDSCSVQPLSLFIHDKNQDLSLREEAVEVLGKIATEEAIHNLIAVLDSELSEKVSEVLKGGGKPAVMPLIAVLSGGNEPIIWEVSTILGEIRNKRAVKPLVALLLDGSKDDYKRGYCVAVALGKIGDAGAVESLIQLASKHTEDVLTCMSVRALGDIGDDKAVEPLIAILEDEGTVVCSHLRLETCWALGKIRDVRAIKSLIRILGDTRNNITAIRDAAASALVQLDDDRIEIPLLKYYRGKLNSMINSGTSVQDEQQGIFKGVVKLITKLIDKS